MHHLKFLFSKNIRLDDMSSALIEFFFLNRATREPFLNGLGLAMLSLILFFLSFKKLFFIYIF